jgi:hypothetical protein
MDWLLIAAITIGSLLALVVFVLLISFVVFMISDDKENLELDYDFDE